MLILTKQWRILHRCTIAVQKQFLVLCKKQLLCGTVSDRLALRIKEKVSKNQEKTQIPSTITKNVHIERKYAVLIEKAAKRRNILTEIKKVTDQIETFEDPLKEVANSIKNPFDEQQVQTKLDLEKKLQSLSIELKNIERL